MPVALFLWFFVPPRLLVAIIIMPIVLTALLVMLRLTLVLHIIVPVTLLPLLHNLRFEDWLWATTVHKVVAQFAITVALSATVAASPVSLRTLLLLLLVSLDLARLAENLVSGGDPLIDGVEQLAIDAQFISLPLLRAASRARHFLLGLAPVARDEVRLDDVLVVCFLPLFVIECLLPIMLKGQHHFGVGSRVRVLILFLRPSHRVIVGLQLLLLFRQELIQFTLFRILREKRMRQSLFDGQTMGRIHFQ